MTDATIGAVIVEYESGPHLEEAILSLAAQDVAIDPIVVVANSPVDAAAVSAIDPRVQVVESENVGYGAGVNRGVDEMPARDFVVVMNPDVVFTAPDAVQTMCAAFARDPRIALTAPRLCWSEGSLQRTSSLIPGPVDEIVEHTFLRRTPWGSRRVDRLWMAEWDRQTSKYVDVVSGACFAARMAAFEEVGGFDPGYFLYFEEVDLCRRLVQAGWTCYFCADAEASHIGGQSTDHGFGKAHFERSRRRYIAKHHGRRAAAGAQAVFYLYGALRRVKGTVAKNAGPESVAGNPDGSAPAHRPPS